MRKRKSVKRHTHLYNEPISWLPIDSRIIPFISFPHVHGLARVFIIVEMVLSVAIVLGSFTLVLLTKLH